MRVLQVTPAFYPAHLYGGPIQSIYELSWHLGRNGCEVRVLTTNANGLNEVLNVETSKDLELGVNLRVRYCKRLLRHSVSPSLLTQLPACVDWADIVHLRAVYSFPTIFTLLICKMLGKPIVWTPHGAFQRWKGQKRLQVKVMWERICKLVAPDKMIIHTASEKEAQTAFDHFPNVDIAVIPHGIQIPPAVVHESRADHLRLLYMGRLHPIKGIEQLLDACNILKDRSRVNWMLTLAGQGGLQYTRVLKERINKLGLCKQIQFAGEVINDAKQQIFRMADVLIVPSLTESFSLVVAEALAHEVPVIASTGTPWNRLDEMGCGLWVSNDPESLAAAIEKITQLPLREMGLKGREWMEKEFSWEYCTQQVLSCYRELLQ